MDQNDCYTRVGFMRSTLEDNPTVYVQSGDNETIKKWISRSSHGYVIEKKASYTVFEFKLPHKEGEDDSKYADRAIKHAISLYHSYEKSKDKNVEYYLS